VSRFNLTRATLATGLGAALIAAPLAPAAAQAATGEHRGERLAMTCTTGRISYHLDKGLILLLDRNFTWRSRGVITGCQVFTNDFAQYGYPKGSVSSLTLDYTGQGHGRCPQGGQDLTAQGRLTFPNGKATVWTAGPFELSVTQSTEVPGQISDGPGKGGNFIMHAKNDMYTWYQCATPIGANEGLLALDELNVYLPDSVPEPTGQQPQPGQPTRPNRPSGDGTTPDRKTLVPAGEPHQVGITVRNSGQTELRDITAVDATLSPNAKLSRVRCEARSLAIGQSTRCGGIVTVPAGASLNTSTFLIKATSPQGGLVSVKKDIYTYTG
jgi:hypothetical protein